MAEEPIEFRGCYLHPSRPAIRDCINCERPICALCEEESGDPLLCEPCREELEELESGVSVPFSKDELRTAGERKAPVDVGEVTILEDGQVVEPPSPKTVVQKDEAGDLKAPSGKPAAGERPSASPRAAEPARKVKKPLPPELRTIRRQAPAPPPRKSTEPPADRKPEPEEAPGPTIVKRERPARPERLKREKQPRQRQAQQKAPRPKKEPRYYDGPVAQALSGLPLALAAALVVSGLWLLFAFLAKQWSQVAIFTLGIVVPWVYYKSTTLRKKAGVPVWAEPSRPLWVAVPSLVIVAALVVPLQLLAFKLIYGSNPARLPFSDFMDRFFKSFDWLLLVLGLLLAFVVPFLLDAGGDLAKPARLRRQGSDDDSEDEDEKAAESEGPAQPETDQEGV